MTLHDLLPLLSDYGLLPLTDARVPAVAQLVAGEPISGSWWAHTQGDTIYTVANALDGHGDVLALPLLWGKVTFLHRRLWAALAGVAMERGAWQLSGLDAEGRELLATVDRQGAVRPGKDRGQAGKSLARRLLVRSWSEHTSSGRHALVLGRWTAWTGDRGVVPLPAAEGRFALETAAAGLSRATRPALPWDRWFREQG